MRKTQFYLSLAFLFTVVLSHAQMSESALDELVENTIKTFDVPGISVGIIEDGKVQYAKGHGVRSLNNHKPMDEHTLVGIASNSKGFTCFALGMLVDEGKLNWNDKVRKYIPEFKLYDAYVTEEFTVKDLVTHRSGLTLGAGDLMFFPEGNKMTIDDIIKGVSHLEPRSSFRSEFMYNNNMFNIAGEVIHRISGLTWGEFIDQKILKPVGMTESYPYYNAVTDKSNIIDAHAPVNGEVKAIAHDWSELANPAGGIVSNIHDMLIWADFLMNGAVTKDGTRLLSEDEMHHLWTLHTPIPVRKNNDYNMHFYGYGLGWFLSDAGGTLEVTHSGGLIGTVTKFTLLPEKKVGIVVLTNQQSGAAFSAINNTIKDSYLGFESRDWVKRYGERTKNYAQEVKEHKEKVYAEAKAFNKSKCVTDAHNILGTYQDAWLGNAIITNRKDKLYFTLENQPQLKGELIPYNSHTYIVMWENRSFDADAFVNFTFYNNGKAKGFTMEPISDITDFSFDFVDLNFSKVE
ncbi:serine hydrolase [Flavobacteriaceae bacterium Ap0902]|nr:serine hydrolase [Flavobacteriaceae bacterium Ap0902]